MLSTEACYTTVRRSGERQVLAAKQVEAEQIMCSCNQMRIFSISSRLIWSLVRSYSFVVRGDS